LLSDVHALGFPRTGEASGDPANIAGGIVTQCVHEHWLKSHRPHADPIGERADDIDDDNDE
jgi:hypothetical protein